MLHVCAVGDPSGTYYLNEEEPPVEVSRWVGRGARALGLAGAVSPADLGAVLAGRGCGGRNVASSRRVSGYDLVFTAPKSASLLWAFGDVAVEQAVRVSHGEAWLSAFDYLAERAAAVRRRSGPDRRLLAVEGLVAAAFTHGQSRAGDPHLHTHVLVANLARGTDGRWTAIDGRGLFAHAGAAGALYGAQLRRAVTDRLGAEWVRTRRGQPEIDGVDPIAIGGFSSRSAEIRAELAAGARQSSTARRVARVLTRDAKVGGDRVEAWQGRAARLGVEPGLLVGGLRRTGGRGRPGGPAPPLDEHRFAAALERVGGPARRRHLVAAWADAVLPGARTPDVLACIDRIDARPGIGVDEPVLEVRAVPAPHQLRALGPRPTDPGELDLWQRAATALERYREQWAITGHDPLGPWDDRHLAGLPAARLASHLEAVQHLESARRLLGRRGREAAGPERGLGIGLG